MSFLSLTVLSTRTVINSSLEAMIELVRFGTLKVAI